MRKSLAFELPLFMVLAVASAMLFNALAGPRRRLEWFPQGVAAPGPVSSPPDHPVPSPTPALKANAPSLPPNPMSASRAPSPVTLTKSVPLNVRAPRQPENAMAELVLRFPPDPAQPFRDLTSEEAKWLHDHGALFLDARRTDAFEAGHIASAKCFPVWEEGLAAKVEQLAAFSPDPGLPVVAYCNGGDCHDSHLLGEKLMLAGFRNIWIYGGGYPDWEAKGWPVKRGPSP